MTDDIGGSTKIEKLNDSNFHAWKQKITLLLALRDLDNLIDDDPPTEKDEYLQWSKKDRKAQAIIGLSLSDEHLEHVRETATAKEMWESILNVFERHTLLNKLSARRKFYTVTMEHGEKMLTYLNRVNLLAATLKSMGVDIDNKELAMAALNGLPSTYESLIVALDALGNEEKSFTFELVKSRLLQEEQRAQDRMENTTVPKTSALVGVNNQNNNQGFQKRQHKYSNHRCENCGTIGHSANHCWGKNVNGRRPPNPNSADRKQSNSNALVVDHNVEPNRVISQNDYVCLMSKINQSNYPKGASSWICDSGCTAHMTYDRSLFDTYESVSNANVEMGTKATTGVVGKGSVILKLKCDSSYEFRKLQNVLHIPSFEYSLLSVGEMDKKGMTTTFGNGHCVITKGSSIIASGYLDGSLHVINTQTVKSPNNAALIASLQLWHERMAHVSIQGILQMADRGVVNGLKVGNRDSNLVCNSCCIGKAHRSAIPQVRTSSRVSKPLARVHSDVCGPIEIPSLGGSTYYVTFIDEYSNWVTVYLMQRKSEVARCYLEFEKYAERQTGQKVLVLRSDRGGEYLSDTLQNYFKHRGIVHELITAYKPHQNGIDKRFNRTALNLIRSMLQHMKVPKCFWAEALSTAVYIRNRVTSAALPSDITPHHLWKGFTPDISHLRVFGCKCWYTIPKSKVKKLDDRSRCAIFVGYAESSKAYKVIDLESRKVVVSRDVTFDEKSNACFHSGSESVHFNFSNDNRSSDRESMVSLDTDSNKPEIESEDGNSDANITTQTPHITNDDPDKTDPLAPDLAQASANEDENDGNETEHISSEEHVTRSGRVSKPPGTWWQSFSNPTTHNALMAASTRAIPKSYKEAISGPDANFWKQGIASEIASLKKYNTWKLVPRSSTNGRNVLTTKWVFVEKQMVYEKGVVTPFPNGRNVVRGFEQVQGVDYGETFAPVVKFTSVRVLCAFVADEDLEFHQMDAKTAFLNGEIDEEIFIEVPDGVEIDDDDLAELGLTNYDEVKKLDLVCKLQKSMYGTKQAPRCWNNKIHSVLFTELGFQTSDADPCIYVKHDMDGVMIIALYVDDLLLAAKTISQISWMKKMFCKRFEMKDLGEAKVCLGLEINRNRREKKLVLTQESYMKKVVDRFGMTDSKPVPTPMEEPKSIEDRLEWESEEDQNATDIPYREAIGSLMYLMIGSRGSRPDLAFAVGKLARFCESPKWKHWIAVKRVLRYVNGTSNMGLCYKGQTTDSVFGYTDSDWAGDVSDRKSTSAYVFMVAGAAVSWCSRKQTITATSSCEAEYIAASMACKEAVWLKRLLSVIPIRTNSSDGMRLLADSQSAMKLAQNESINRRNKHIDITYHYVREVTNNADVRLTYCPTEDMAADMLTKALGRIKFEKLRTLCGISVQGDL